MKNLVLIFLLLFLGSCAVFQPAKFDNMSLKEKLVTKTRDSITLEDIFIKNRGKKNFVQVYATYCPVSQDSFKDVIDFQKKHTNVNYIFLSVDHSYYDWKRALDKLKIKGQHYYIPKKGKGALAKFLKLKTIPRFILMNEEGKIEVYKSSEVSRIEQKF